MRVLGITEEKNSAKEWYLKINNVKPSMEKREWNCRQKSPSKQMCFEILFKIAIWESLGS